ncbi:MAG: ECF transporter S component [Culicoidibacterales bacterium]
MNTKQNLKLITLTAMLLAFYVVIRQITPSIPIIPGVIQINLAYFILPVIGMLLGAKMGFFLGVIADLILFSLSPTIFNPFFTLNEGLFCMMGGLFFHQKDLGLRRIIWANLFIAYVGITLASTIALVFQYWILVPNVTRLWTVVTSALLFRFITATFVYIPLLTALFYFPKKQWAYLSKKIANYK